MRTVHGLEEMQTLVGQELGVSDWHRVTQEEVDLFAKATHDHQWIHVDPERCRRESPFGGPIAHGYYTIALAPALLAQVLAVQGVRMGVNYGLNKMRLPSPVPVGSRVRLRATLAAYEPIPGGASVTIGLTFEVEAQPKPACVAEVIYRYYA
jgi:acyl dehydratase